jgi:hypothetical protein
MLHVTEGLGMCRYTSLHNVVRHKIFTFYERARKPLQSAGLGEEVFAVSLGGGGWTFVILPPHPNVSYLKIINGTVLRKKGINYNYNYRL